MSVSPVTECKECSCNELLCPLLKNIMSHEKDHYALNANTGMLYCKLFAHIVGQAMVAICNSCHVSLLACVTVL